MNTTTVAEILLVLSIAATTVALYLSVTDGSVALQLVALRVALLLVGCAHLLALYRIRALMHKRDGGDR